jgi:hypothetical protein
MDALRLAHGNQENQTLGDAECRRHLHWAQSCIDTHCPPGFWKWLEKNHRCYHMRTTTEFMDKVNRSWGTPGLAKAVNDFLTDVSVAIAIFH